MGSREVRDLGISTGLGIRVHSADLQICEDELVRPSEHHQGSPGRPKEGTWKGDSWVREGVLLGRASTWEILGFCKCGDAGLRV